MATAEEKRLGKNTLILEDRSKLSVTAVKDAPFFEESKIVLITEQGELTIQGSGLHISKLSTDTGEVSIEGTSIDYMVYTDDDVEKGGFFSRLFR